MAENRVAAKLPFYFYNLLIKITTFASSSWYSPKDLILDYNNSTKINQILIFEYLNELKNKKSAWIIAKVLEASLQKVIFDRKRDKIQNKSKK